MLQLRMAEAVAGAGAAAGAGGGGAAAEAAAMQLRGPMQGLTAEARKKERKSYALGRELRKGMVRR